MHWRLISALLRRTPAAVTVPLYALAPQHGMDDAYRLLDAVTERLGDHAPAGPVVYAGDSAGATLALTYAIRQRDTGAANQPAALVLFSPGVDLTMTNPAITALEPRDSILTSAQVRTVGQWWSGGRPLSDPAVSPLRADLSGLPPAHLFAGDQEILFPDIEAMHDKIRLAGGSSTLTVARGGFHDYPVAFWTPESRQALDLAAAAVGESAVTYQRLPPAPTE
jgi:monoterpene epsilon-lactone hydrolase